MHKKGNAVIGVIVVVLLFAGGAFVYSQQYGSPNETNQATSSPTTAAEDDFYGTSTNSSTTTIDSTADTDTEPSDNSQDVETAAADQEVAAWKAAVDGGGSVRCSVNPDIGTAESITIFVSSGKFRQNATFADRAKRYTISRNGETISWSEGAETGQGNDDRNIILQSLKFLLDDEDTERVDPIPAMKNQELESLEDLIASSIVECEQSSVDESIFEKPEGVNFSG